MYNKNPGFGLITLSGFLVLDLGINESTYQIDSGAKLRSQSVATEVRPIILEKKMMYR
jgi:hypothetical protein